VDAAAGTAASTVVSGIAATEPAATTAARRIRWPGR